MEATMVVVRSFAERIIENWECDDYYRTPSGYNGRCGYFPPTETYPLTHQWNRQSGAWMSITHLGDGLSRIDLSGARHALRELFYAGLTETTPWGSSEDAISQEIASSVVSWEVVQSERPDLAPWQTESPASYNARRCG